MLSKEQIELLYFETLQKMKFFENIDKEYTEYLNGCLDALEKVLELEEV